MQARDRECAGGLDLASDMGIVERPLAFRVIRADFGSLL